MKSILTSLSFCSLLISCTTPSSPVTHPDTPVSQMNTRSDEGLRKGVLELCILRVLGQAEAYASDLLDNLRKADMLVVEGTLYPLLTRMKNAGWLDYRWEESKSGPPRKYYRLTELGQEILSDLDREWLAFTEAVASLSR